MDEDSTGASKAHTYRTHQGVSKHLKVFTPPGSIESTARADPSRPGVAPSQRSVEMNMYAGLAKDHRHERHKLGQAAREQLHDARLPLLPTNSYSFQSIGMA